VKGTRVMVMVMVSVALVGGLGCGDKSPKEKCDDLFGMVCDRAVECIPGAAGMRNSCIQFVRDQKICDNVKSVTDNYEACMDQLGSVSCQQLFPTSSGGSTPTGTLPGVCMGVLSTQPSGDAPGLPASLSLPGALHGMAGALD